MTNDRTIGVAALGARRMDLTHIQRARSVLVGDVLLGGKVDRQSVILRNGPDYPWDGGIAWIRSCTCCDAFGGSITTARRAGGKGAVRALLQGVDIALVSHEGTCAG